jgi:DNA anti-recombination protein RmuC
LRANLHRTLEADIEERFRDETDLLAQIQQGLENM